MKIKGFIVLIGVITLMLGSCGKSSLNSAKLKSKEDSLSYAFGIVNYNALKTDSLMLDPMIVAKAMMDGKKGKPLMADDIARSYIMMFINKREAAKQAIKAEADKIKYKDYIEQNEAFLAKNKTKTGAFFTEEIRNCISGFSIAYRPDGRRKPAFRDACHRMEQ